MAVAIPIIGAAIAAGASIYGAVSQSNQAQSQYDYEQQQAQLQQQQSDTQLQNLVNYQGTQSKEFSAQQATELAGENASLGAARTALNQNIQAGAASVLGQEASYAQEASSIQASAASRGLSVGGSAASSGAYAAEGGTAQAVIGGGTQALAGQNIGSVTTPGYNDYKAGTAATTTTYQSGGERGMPVTSRTVTTPGTAATGIDIPGTTTNLDIPGVAATPGGVVGYVGSGKAPTSQNEQLQIYEENAMKGIQLAQTGLANAAAAGWTNIGTEQGLFTQRQSEALSGFNAAQSQQLTQAESGDQYALAQQNLLSSYQTSQLQSSEESAWVNAFAGVAQAGFTAAGQIWTPTMSPASTPNSNALAYAEMQAAQEQQWW